jgi:hypothetical protein
VRLPVLLLVTPFFFVFFPLSLPSPFRALIALPSALRAFLWQCGAFPSMGMHWILGCAVGPVGGGGALCLSLPCLDLLPGFLLLPFAPAWAFRFIGFAVDCRSSSVFRAMWVLSSPFADSHGLVPWFYPRFCCRIFPVRPAMPFGVLFFCSLCCGCLRCIPCMHTLRMPMASACLSC